MKQFQIVEVEAPAGMQTAMSRVCIACGAGLSAGGGGGAFLCLPCVETLTRGPWRGNLRKLRDSTTEELLTVIDLL